jgi:hypothetical protein
MKKYLSVFISLVLLVSPVTVVGQAFDFPATIVQVDAEDYQQIINKVVS